MRVIQHKIYRRERPIIRKVILKILQEEPSAKLEDISQGYFISIGRKVLTLGGIQIQARKMLEEKQGLYSVNPI